MTYLSEDPTYLAAGLLAAGRGLLGRTQRHAARQVPGPRGDSPGAGAGGGGDRVVVGDRQRADRAGRLRPAAGGVATPDVDGVLAHMAPNVQYLQGDTALSEDATRALIRANLSHARFEFVRISDLQTSAGAAIAAGESRISGLHAGAPELVAGDDRYGGTSVTTWSLGFQETEPGVWKVNRISPVSIPRGILALPGGLPPTDGSHLGFNDGIGLPRPKGRVPDSRRPGLRPRGSASRAERPLRTRTDEQPLQSSISHSRADPARGCCRSAPMGRCQPRFWRQR